MALSQRDRDILRRLAERQAAIATLPVHQERAELWRRLNQLEPTRPLVWINEIPWHEMDVNGELRLQAEDPWAREQETILRRTLYQWDHMPCDMVVNDYLMAPMAIYSTGLGIDEDVDIAVTDEANDVVSRRFRRQIIDPEDIQKIRAPVVTHDEAETNVRLALMRDVFGDVIELRPVGIKGRWFAPWDELIRWWGVEDAMLDLVDRPQMVNDCMVHLLDCYLHELDQWETLNLLTCNNDNTRVGSGGYAYTDELPGDAYDPMHVRASDLWGSSTSQIFSAVSPDMHWEFGLQHEMRWLKRFGLTYYGCCEPLDRKMQILRRIPNLRKVSMSPWVDLERGARELGTDYVFSYKPSPACLAEDHWRPDRVRNELRDALERMRGCRVEIIMKDISTVRYQPQRLWEWARIAMELTEALYPERS